ncbi:MAG: NUDIX hydrolase [Pseudomonadota bacterium]
MTALPPVRPVAAVIAVMMRDGEVLLVQRGRPPDLGLWGFPGGKIEPGETVETAVLRELREETGIIAEPLGVLTAIDVFHHAEDGTLTSHHVLIAVLCKWISGDPVAADDAADARWFGMDVFEPAGLPLSKDVARVAHLAAARLGM